MAEYTVYRSLSMLKAYDDRIYKTIKDNKFVSVTMGKTGMADGITVQAQTANIRAAYDKVKALIDNYCKLKIAVLEDNAGIKKDTANVKRIKLSNGMEVTTAGLIEIQKSRLGFESKGIIGYDKKLINKLKSDLKDAKRVIEDKNVAVERGLENFLNSLNSGDKNASGDVDIAKLTESYRDNHSWKLVDPLELDKLIPQLEESFDKLAIEIDAKISENNALSVISVDLAEA